MKLSELIDTSTISVISLETTNESVFGSDIIYKISNGEIYIGDNQQKAILVFSDTGKFRGKIDRQGRGPEEYTDLKDFIIQEDSIMILDYRRIVYYDKNNFSFIKSINLAREGIVAINMSADDSSYYFLNLDYSAE